MANEYVVEVKDADFQKEVMQSDVPVVVDFWAPWCAPCRAIAPILDELAAKYAGKIKVAKINVDENAAAAGQFRVTAIPTVLIVKGGTVQEQIVGSKKKSFFDETIAKYV